VLWITLFCYWFVVLMETAAAACSHAWGKHRINQRVLIEVSFREQQHCMSHSIRHLIEPGIAVIVIGIASQVITGIVWRFSGAAINGCLLRCLSALRPREQDHVIPIVLHLPLTRLNPIPDVRHRRHSPGSKPWLWLPLGRSGATTDSSHPCRPVASTPDTSLPCPKPASRTHLAGTLVGHPVAPVAEVPTEQDEGSSPATLTRRHCVLSWMQEATIQAPQPKPHSLCRTHHLARTHATPHAHSTAYGGALAA